MIDGWSRRLHQKNQNQNEFSKVSSNSRPKNMESHIIWIWMIYIQYEFSKMSLKTCFKNANSYYLHLNDQSSEWAFNCHPQMAYLNRKKSCISWICTIFLQILKTSPGRARVVKKSLGTRQSLILAHNRRRDWLNSKKNWRSENGPCFKTSLPPGQYFC